MNEKDRPVAPEAPKGYFPKRAGYVLRVVAVNFLIFAVLAELISVVLVHGPNWPSSRPSYHLTYDLFWTDINPFFGVWHRSSGVFVHKGGCYDVTYYTNSYGARDVERSLHSAKPRTVILGDSMIEGLGLPADQRLSNILEKETGREHLNFGTGGNFGPLQDALLYKNVAAPFDHDLVVVGILPDNDFHDMDVDFYRARGVGNRYRPYYADDFSVYYTGHFDPTGGESAWDHVDAFLRTYLASYHVGQYIYSRFYWRTMSPYSGYNDYTPVDLARLQRALQDIKATADARHARMKVFLIPRARDFFRLRTSGSNRLGPVLESWGREVGIPIKDLLPPMNANAEDNYPSYFLHCDGHWDAHGNREAANILEPWLYPDEPVAARE